MEQQLPVTTSTENPVKIKTRAGVITIIGFAFLFSMLVGALSSADASFDTFNGLSDMMLLASIVYASIYSFIVKKYHIVGFIKRSSLIILAIILTAVSAAFLDIYTRTPSSGISAIEKMGAELEAQNFAEKKLEVLAKNEKATTLLASIEQPPQSKEEANQYIDVIDSVITLVKDVADTVEETQKIMLNLVNNAETPEEKAEIKRVFKNNFNQDLDVLPAYTNQFNIFVDANIKNLEARKKYYESYINGEPDNIQDFLFNEWDKAEDIYIAEQGKLLAINAQFVGGEQ